VYLPLNARTVLPGRRYRFVAEVPEALGLVAPGARVRAETLVPDTFRVVTPPPASVRYNPFGVPPQLTVTPSAYPGRQAIYLFSIQALDPQAGLTPTYAAFLNEEQAERLIEGTSPLLNEENYTRNPDGTLTLEIPWLAIVYYGPNRFTASALDDGLYDYLRSRDTQFSGGTLSPGEIPEVLSNVENGTGVFGSVAQRAVEVTIERAGG